MSRPIGIAEQIFLELADVSVAERDRFLDERCAGDAQLRADVDAMLAALDAPDEEFLDPASMPALDMGAIDGPLQPGTVLGDFLVLHAIGSGGMGVVYAAQQDRPRRTVAIKVLRRGYRHPEILKRFEREAEVLGRLQHPGIAQVFAFHVGDRRVPAHLVMELVAGPPITEYVQAHRLDLAARIRLTIAVCEAVQHAHDRGVIHRDLKPANVLVTESGQPKVLDFGVARIIGPDLHSTLQTSHGQMIGTLAFMSPEQLRSAPADIDARSDVYALGVLFYRLMSGRLPFDIGGLPLLEAAQRILQTDVPRLGTIAPELGGSIEAVADRAMSRELDRRYQSATDLARDLAVCLDGGALAGSPPDLLGGPSASRQPLVAASADSRFVALGLATGAVVILDAATGATLAIIRAAGSPLERLAFENDGRLAIERSGGAIERIEIARIT